MSEYALGELERMASNMIRYGVIAELDAAEARVKVLCGGLVTDWLPWGAGRAGGTRKWSPPQVGEQVVVFSPYGDPAQAFVGHSIFQDDHPAPAASADLERVVFSDGTTIDYSTSSNTLTVQIAGAGIANVVCKQATVQASEKVTLDTPTTDCTGDMNVAGKLTYGNGIAGTGGTNGNHITGDITVVGGDVKADAISLKGHGHIEQGDGARTSNATT